MRKTTLLAILIGVFSMPVQAGFVDCDTSTSPSPIRDAINSGDRDIEFVGTCTENIFYDHPEPLRLRGQGPVASILEGGVSVRGSLLSLSDFRIEGVDGVPFLSDSVFIGEGASGRISNMTMNLPRAFFVFVGATANVNGSVINHVGTVKDCPIVCIGDNSQVRFSNTEVTAEINDPVVGAAISVLRDSSVVMRGGNTVTNSGSSGAIAAVQDSSIRVDDPLGNGSDMFNGGLLVRSLSLADVRQGTFNGPVTVTRHSLLDLGKGLFGAAPGSIEVNGDIDISKDSSLEVFSPLVKVNGAIICADAESSMNTSDFGGSHTIDCTDYDNKKIRVKGNNGQGN